MNIISGLKDFFKDNSVNNALKCPLCADAVGYSLITKLPIVFLVILSTLLENIGLGKSTISCIPTFNKFASILSAIFSSAISMVI